jgi:hypothetical protein
MEKSKIDKINYKIEEGEILKHLTIFINLTQEFNQKGKTKLVDHTLKFMKDFIKMLNKEDEDKL